MSNKLTQQDIQHVAKLARLKCTEQEITQFTVHLGNILDYVGQLQEVDTENVEPLAHCLSIHNVLRKDELSQSLSNDKALVNAPGRDGEFFSVPKVLDSST